MVYAVKSSTAVRARPQLLFYMICTSHAEPLAAPLRLQLLGTNVLAATTYLPLYGHYNKSKDDH